MAAGPGVCSGARGVLHYSYKKQEKQEICGFPSPAGAAAGKPAQREFLPMDKAKIDRINALARKAKAGPLTPEELAERDALRKEYLEAVRKNFRAQMDRIVIVEPDGTRHGVGRPHPPECKN